MEAKTPPASRGMRPHIALAGLCNGGKSSLLNALLEQDAALVSPLAGTTTDPVCRNCELLPFGPVTFVDTPGLDDATELGDLRARRAARALREADAVCLVTAPENLEATLDAWEAQAAATAGTGNDAVPLLVVVSRCPGGMLPAELAAKAPGGILSAGNRPSLSDRQVRILGTDSPLRDGTDAVRQALVELLQSRKDRERALLADLIRPCKLVLMVVPIDLEAPKGRLILPQVQAIREVLDSDAATLVVKEREIEWALSLLKSPPDLAITDSQVVLKAAGSIPPSIPLTTFSILFSRLKGDLQSFVESARVIDTLADGDRILIAETCSHRSSCDDIGRVKIPRWLRQHSGRDLDIRTHTGPLPADLSDYRLVIHCGGCMITRRMMLSRMEDARNAGVAITNYGLAISRLQGVLDRVVEPLGY